jgi:cell division septation protein DedD
MKMLEKLKKNMNSMPRTRAAGSADSENAPKNGPLTLAVIASILLTVFLGALNVKLMSDPSGSPGALRRSVHSKSERANAQTSCSVKAVPQPAAPKKDPPPMSFYQTLTVQEEQPPATVGPESDAKSGTCPTTPLQTADSAAKPGSKETAEVSEAERRKRARAPLRLPGNKGGKKRYTVQVGVFSHPAVAKQWAAKWKTRGFTVILKPVARPKTGVTYRLYLGSFSSKKQADEMVKRLKKKEGITAFRVAFRK